MHYTDVEQVGDAMHFLREPLETDQVGVTIARCKPGWIGRKHDHSENGHEEVYVLFEGQADVEVDGEMVSMEAGDAIRISADATRQIRNGETESAFVLVSAPEFDANDEWEMTGFVG
ncbi:Mannose-6-phosphate isomerase, cupin superfamily [Haladaptatus litoreus]|uniref:Mannose-6-phosphate isomerase, cupin superfamily n=1 Tax=Haladaptatus litoreus TaxID=553468 RepID=A0A1N7CTS9_9EURY|nr:Mannose-6-phosphate isomerase, cupin superfamily [Haladaptatus litoreus]